MKRPLIVFNAMALPAVLGLFDLFVPGANDVDC